MRSRRNLARSFETAKRKEKKTREMATEPMELSINKYRQETAFGNYRLCYFCGTHTVNAEVSLDEEFTDKSKRRMEKYHICSSCKDGKGNNNRQQVERDPGISMKVSISEHKKLFSPVTEQVANEVVSVNDISSSQVLFPTSQHCLDIYDNKSWTSLNTVEMKSLLYTDTRLDSHLLSLLYSNQMNKYANSSNLEKMYIGKIADPNLRTITGLKVLTEDNRLAGSSSWRKEFLNDLQWRMFQIGRFCMAVSFEVSMDNEAIIATNLVQNNVVVTAEFYGESSLELKRRYFVHADHDNSVDCSGLCNKIELGEYLANHNLQRTSLQLIATYISLSDQVLQSALRNIVQSHASQLRSEVFQFTTVIDAKGTIKVIGVIWPEILMKTVNYQNVHEDATPETRLIAKKDLMQALEGTIGTTSKLTVLMSQFKISEAKAKTLQSLVRKNQVHACRACLKCDSHPMPSLSFLIKEIPDHEDNIVSSRMFLQFMRDQMDALPMEVLQNMSTSEFIDTVWSDSEETRIGNRLIIENSGQSFEFVLEAKLLELREEFHDDPLAAVYQFSLGCELQDGRGCFVLKRTMLLDCFTDPYCQVLLRSVEAPVIVKPISSVEEFSSWLESDDTTANIPAHRKISIVEALATSDQHKLKQKSSPTTESVKVKESSYYVFQKTDEANEDSYIHDGKFYDLLLSNVNKLDNRLNGRSLFLCEACSWYDYVGKEKSLPLFNVYKDKLDKVQETDCTSLSGAKLPEYLITSSGHVMKKRRVPKILKYETFNLDSPEHKYSQVLLFGKYEKIADLSEARVNEIFCEEEDGENVIKRIRKKFLYTMRFYNL